MRLKFLIRDDKTVNSRQNGSESGWRGRMLKWVIGSVCPPFLMDPRHESRTEFKLSSYREILGSHGGEYQDEREPSGI
jgi:hypothetical protein